MTRAQLEQALTDDNIQKAHTAYERAWLDDFKIKRNHSSDKADAAAVLAMRQSLVSALLAVEPTPMPWQPIETAPKDGTMVWLGKPYTIRTGFWSNNVSGWIDYARSENFGGPQGLVFEPTHWMRLPAPPEAGTKGEG